MINKIVHPYFLSISVILLAYLFVFCSIEIDQKKSAGTVTNLEMSLGRTGLSGKLKTTMTYERTSDDDDENTGYSSRNTKSVQETLDAATSAFNDVAIVPRFYRAYSTTIFILCIWALLVFCIKDSMPYNMKMFLFFGILGTMLLQILVTLYEQSVYKPFYKTEMLKLQNTYHFSFGTGFYLFFFGLLGLMFSTFFYKGDDVKDLDFSY